MKNFLICRRTFVSVLAIGCLTGLGFYQGTDVSMAIAGIAGAIGAANAYEAVGKEKKGMTYGSTDT